MFHFFSIPLFFFLLNFDLFPSKGVCVLQQFLITSISSVLTRISKLFYSNMSCDQIPTVPLKMQNHKQTQDSFAFLYHDIFVTDIVFKTLVNSCNNGYLLVMPPSFE